MDDIDNDLNLLRSLVTRELETVNAYRRLASECDDETTVEFIRHVVDEEKIHIADTLRAIAVLDEDQHRLLMRGFEDGHRADDASHGFDRITRISKRSTNARGDLVGLDSVVHSAQKTRLHSDRAVGASDLAATDSPVADPEENPVDGQLDQRNSQRIGDRLGDAWTVGSLRGLPQNE